uniref:CULT domain-containing protein n=1 Tax=Caenorhabditis tropicalis TaxID=1561998 RepID=A0A1I7T5R2_9PELO
MVSCSSANEIIKCVFVTVSSRHVGEILCRQCGASVTRQSEFINVTGVDSSQLAYEYDFPLAGKTTKVHVLTNPEGHKFHMFGAKTAHLNFHGTPQSHATWYPGYKWTICLCKVCNRHLGWYFEVDKSTVLHMTSEKKNFVGLVLDNVISADYVDTLTRVPNF